MKRKLTLSSLRPPRKPLKVRKAKKPPPNLRSRGLLSLSKSSMSSSKRTTHRLKSPLRFKTTWTTTTIFLTVLPPPAETEFKSISYKVYKNKR